METSQGSLSSLPAVFSRGAWRALWTVAGLAAVALAGASLWLGELNQDEGWYLYAARLVAEGWLPYVDFAHTQPPVMPFVYALAHPLVKCCGLAGGRLFTAVLGLGAALVAAGLARRAAPPERGAVAALVAFALVAINVYQSTFTTTVKTYALAGLCLVGGMLLLAVRGGRGKRLAAVGAGIALALAAGTRLSAAIALPVVLGYLWYARRERPGDWWRFLVGAGVTASVIFLPFLWAAPECFIFDVFRYHTARKAGGWLPLFVYKVGFVSRVVQAYFVACGLLVAVLVARWLRAGGTPGEGGCPVGRGLTGTLWLVVATVSLVHFAAPFPYDDYQVMVAPLAGAALAVMAVRTVRGSAGLRWLAVTVLLVSLAGAVSSPLNQGWVIRGRDRIWWLLKEEPPLRRLQKTAARVRALAGPDGLLLTQDTYLAVEAGLRVPRGMELGPFCYYPALTTARARAQHVLNRPLLESVMRDCGARVAAFSGYGLAIRAPEIVKLPPEEQADLRAVLLSVYEPVDTVTEFGQGDTVLTVYTRRAWP